jgi:hypothetical protein
LAQELLQFDHPSTKVIQKVDYIIVCAPAEETSQERTRASIDFLAKKGYKVSKAKAQLCQNSDKYLRLIRKGTQKLREERIKPITSFPTPRTLKWLGEFGGITRFCRLWIPTYGEMACPLYQTIKDTQKSGTHLLE